MKINDFMNIKRIEFTITKTCTSRCKHCSLGNVINESKIRIDKDIAVSVVKELSSEFNIESVMTFGGEPLLFSDTTCAIHKTATENNIPKRQIITNGYFSNDIDKISTVVKAIKESGINSLLLSIDAFHKEFISLEKVYQFAKLVCNENISGFKLHPAWVVNRQHINKYNEETEECLNYFKNLHIPVSDGNNIFPSGNAAIYLSEFYEKSPIDINMKCGEAPYTEKLNNVETIAINPNGDVVVCCFIIGNIYRNSIIEILKKYNPYENPMMKVLINGGIRKLIELAELNGINIDTSQFYSSCSMCRNIVKRLSCIK